MCVCVRVCVGGGGGVHTLPDVVHSPLSEEFCGILNNLHISKMSSCFEHCRLQVTVEVGGGGGGGSEGEGVGRGRKRGEKEEE